MAYTAINPTQLTPPRVALIDDRSGAISREWYRFFLSLLKATEATENIVDNNGPDATSIASSLDSKVDMLAQSFDLIPPDLGGTVVSVAASGGTTGLTFSGSPITVSGTLTLGGTLAVTNGGTGATTASGARTNLGATTVGGNFFTLTNPSAVTFPRINADNTVSALDAASFRAAIGAGTGSGSVTSVNASGGTTGMTFSGGPITTSGTLTMSGTLGVANGGTGATTLTSGYLLKGNGTSAISASVAYDNGSAILIGTTTAKSRLTVSSAAFSNAPVLGSAGGIVNLSNPDINYGFLIGVNSADGHAWLQAQRTDGTAASGPITLNEAGGNVAIGKSTAATALDVNGTVTATSFTGAGTGLTGTAGALSIGGNAATATTATTATSATTAGSVTNAVTFNNGGAGDASGTTFNGSATRTISYNTIGAQPAGTYVTSVTGTAPVVSSGGATPAISMAAATTSVNGYLTSTDWNTFNGKQAALVSGTNIKTVNGTTLLGSGDLGTITAGYGGTGQSSYTIGDILYASGTTALSKLADVATGNALISGGVGVAPSYGKIGLTTHISGTLAVGNGGTGATTLTSGYLLKGNGTSAVSASAAYDNGSYLLVGTTTTLAGNTSNEYKNTTAGLWPLTLNSNDRGLLMRQSAAASGFYAYFEYNGGTNNGSISWAGGVTAYNTVSDVRTKKNIVEAADGGSIIDGIKVRSWDFKVDDVHWRYGMVAQELLEVFPEAVTVAEDENLMMGVDYSKLVPLLIKEVQSLRHRVATLENM